MCLSKLQLAKVGSFFETQCSFALLSRCCFEKITTKRLMLLMLCINYCRLIFRTLYSRYRRRSKSTSIITAAVFISVICKSSIFVASLYITILSRHNTVPSIILTVNSALSVLLLHTKTNRLNPHCISGGIIQSTASGQIFNNPLYRQNRQVLRS